MSGNLSLVIGFQLESCSISSKVCSCEEEILEMMTSLNIQKLESSRSRVQEQNTVAIHIQTASPETDVTNE